MHTEELTFDGYDRVPYTSHAYAESHPGRLSVVARLSGWTPPPLDGARVLEVGSGRGGNLLAMALGLPGASFVGVEPSARQAEEAASIAAEVGLSGVEIRRRGFEAPDDDGGRFDFVIAHGLASWVAPGARRALLERVRAWLSPGGVAYVSFNALPGWYERLAARDWLRFATDREAGLGEPVAAARASLTWLREQVSPERESLRDALARVEARLGETAPAYLVHEYLEAEHHPQRVSDFLGEARAAGLAYLGDAIPREVAVETLPPRARAVVDGLVARGGPAPAAAASQLVDFVRGTAFRRALLVRDDTARARGWSWPPTLDPRPVRALRLASRLVPAGGGLFRGPAETVSVAGDAARVALERLAELAPRALAFEELAAPFAEAERTELAAALLELWLSFDGIDLHGHAPPFSPTVSERPRACPLARLSSGRGEPVTNRWHQEVRLPEPVVRRVLAAADGARAIGEIAQAVAAPPEVVEASLALLARAALLVG